MEENGLNTGMKAFDELVGKIETGELIVIAGRPGMGKTTLAVQILAKNFLDKKCVYLSIMDDITRSFNNVVSILENSNRSLENVTEVVENKLNKTFHLWTFDYDFISLSIELVKLKIEKGLDYVFIDGFQLLASDLSPKLRAEWLKKLAKSLNVTIFITSQMKRSFDPDRIDSTTINYHLYNFADKVLGVYRKDFLACAEDLATGRIKKGESFLCVCKNNNDKMGRVTAYFDRGCKVFYGNDFEE